jgi:hypothetical protein
VKKNFNWLGVGRHDDEFGDTSIQGLGGLVGSLLGLLVVGGLLDQIQEGHSQICICEWEGFLRHGCFYFKDTKRETEEIVIYLVAENVEISG